MRIFLISALLSLYSIAGAQEDPAARAILDRFSSAALSAPAVSMTFTLVIHDKIEQTTQEMKGEVVISGNMYKLELPDNLIWFDGNSIWTLAPEVKEVTVTLPDPDDNDFFSSPSSLFDMYRENFKFRLEGETQEGSVIGLFPQDPADTGFSMIKLVIDKQNRLTYVEYRRKDGIDMKLDIQKYVLDKNYPPSFFKYDPGKYPDVDIIDMR